MEKLRSIEKKVYSVVFYLLTIGLLVSYSNKERFEGYFVYEDNTVEWLTFGVLAIMAGICFRRFFAFKNKKSKMFLFGTLFAGLLFTFGAGEEVSWFQRQIGYKSSDFFEKHNSQHETNLHNLVLKNGKKINKIIFGTGLGIIIGLYLLVLPLLYDRNSGVKNWADTWGIPIPKGHHIQAYIAMALIASLIHTPKKGELLEFSGVTVFFLILLYPKNEHIFE